MRVGIIGGGASGMAAALTASENPSCEVILFERQARLGRKLQATGNGRCNLTNLKMSAEHYHGDAPAFSQFALGLFPPENTISWFENMGLFTVVEDSGRVYPYSDQANSVLDILRFALDKHNIMVKTGFEVDKVKKTESGFLVISRDSTVICDKLIVACGGLAGTKLGGTMSGYQLMRSLGHHSTKLRPALVQLKTDWPEISGLKGVRANCSAKILVDNKIYSQSEGELQFTEYGLSGPVIFEISRDTCQGKGQWVCLLDFLPHIADESLYKELRKRKNSNLAADELFTGILHNRLGRVLTQSVGISLRKRISELMDKEIELAVSAAKAFEISLKEPLGMDSAQVTAGGILTSEFVSNTLESIKVPGLYACGEVLDIDGDCGGYNLQWAWSSGRLAGLSAGGVKE